MSLPQIQSRAQSHPGSRVSQGRWNTLSSSCEDCAWRAEPQAVVMGRGPSHWGVGSHSWPQASVELTAPQ